MRLFAAINFDKDTKRKILNIQDHLREYASGSFSYYENLHLTLVFLGETEPSKLQSIKDAMQSITIPEMNLVFSHTGYFSKDDGDIWWLGMEYNDALAVLHKDLTEAFTKLGYTPENREYRPHITLARRVRSKDKIDKSLLMDAPFSADVSSLSLMLSKRVNGRMEYTELFSVSSTTQ
ncbi:MAG: RNA 2',3'-cyclic phosphodiesterase [Clostridia bacterium]|nr:RNA 2',3'-cyclic phosphodiesterase [Clostridia bacterium]